MDVGVRELKEHLSEYLDRAARGELIRVTDRGRLKAMLGPIPDVKLLEEGIEQAWIRAARDVAPLAVSRRRSSVRIAGALNDDRGE